LSSINSNIFSIGKNIKQLRSYKSLTLEQLAKECNINNKTFEGYENNNINPPLSNIIKIVSHFGVTIDFLILWNNTKHFHNIKLLSMAKQIDEMEQLHRFQIESMASSLLKGRKKSEIIQDNISLPLTDNFHSNLKTLRENKNINQKVIAELLETNQSMITHYETKSIPPVENLVKLSEYFKISIHALSTGQILLYPFKDGQFGETIFQADQLLTLEEHKMLIHLMEAIIKTA
jgi:transcriptional regulator with XRE-family HTH domain